MRNATQIGEAIRRRRKELGTTQRDIAELAQVSPRSVYALERGKATVRLDVLLSVTDVLGLEIDLRVRS